MVFTLKNHRNVTSLYGAGWQLPLVFPAQKRTAPTYWSVELVGAFEGNLRPGDSEGALPRDLDPQFEPYILGVSSAGFVTDASVKMKSAVFLECGYHVRTYQLASRPPTRSCDNGPTR